jgi:hypothetical protein
MKNKSSLSPEQQSLVASILGEHLNEVSFSHVEVPTKCKWYTTDSIGIRPFTFEDEKYVLNPAHKNKNFLNLLLSRCIQGIEVEDLFLVDRDFLAYKIKEISTGSEVRMEIMCESCSNKNILEIDLNVLKSKPVEGDIPIETMLPTLDKMVKIMPPRVRDEGFIGNFQALSSNLWRFIEEIEGISDVTVISAITEKLPVADVHHVLNALGLKGCGIQTSLNYICGCQHEMEVEVSLSENFFGLS